MMEYLLSKTNSAFDAFFAPSAMYENMLYTIDHTLIVRVLLIPSHIKYDFMTSNMKYILFILMYIHEYIINYFLNHSWFLNLVNGKTIKVTRAEINPKPPKDSKP